MRLIKALIITWVFSAQAGLPPTTLSGQSSATKPTTFGTQVPYNQATSLGGINSLIETGSENMLVDPGMEAPGVTAYTCTSGTCTKTVASGEFSSGKQALKVALTAQALDVSQSVSTVSGIQVQGVVGALYKVPSAITDFRVCSLVAGVEQTCVPSNQLIADNTYRSIEIPVTMTPGSTVGIKFKTTASYTQNVFIDAAYVKQGLGTQNLMLDNVYSAKISITGVVSDEVGDFINGNFVVSPTGTMTGTFTSGKFTATPNCTVIGTTDVDYNLTISSVSTTTVVVKGDLAQTGAAARDSAFILMCQKSGNDYLASSANVYSSTNGNYDWITKTTTLTNMGTSPTITCKYRRSGGNLEGSCSGLAGSAVPAALASITLPDSLALDTARINATNTSAGAGVEVGRYYNQGANNFGAIITATGTSSTLLYFGAATNTTTLLTPTNANVLFSSSAATSFTFSVPIAGWSNSNIILGSFEKIEKCANAYDCADTFTANISSTGVVSNENLDFISGNCTVSGTSLFDCPLLATLKDGVGAITSKLNCTAAVDNNGIASNILVNYDTSVASVSNLRLYTQNSNSGALQVKGFTVSCQKGTNDFKPKTAKIASSIGVPTVPGITTEAIDTFSVSFGTTNATTACSVSPCSYVNQIGSAVSSIIRTSAGLYPLNTSKTYAQLKCISSAGVTGSPRFIYPARCESCNSLTLETYNSAGTATDAFVTTTCTGSY